MGNPSSPNVSHVVIFWTDPAKPDAPDEVIAGAKKYLAPIPGVVNFHLGKVTRSHRDVVIKVIRSG
jgi:hypothetical protein